MSDPYQQEQIEILRRIAERGKGLAERCIERWDDDKNYHTFVDLFQHLLDEIARLKATC